MTMGLGDGGPGVLSAFAQCTNLFFYSLFQLTSFRFLMHPRSDYAVFTMDADVRVQWEDIEQVLIAVPQSCPICLQPPVAARVTKCGHVYCFSCILHYLALSESNKAWRKCPICWDAIYEKDLKSVRTTQNENDIYDQDEKEIAKKIASKENVHIEMRLIQRSLVRQS